jgi:Macroglobulin domain MG3/Macroglobulin domain MG4
VLPKLEITTSQPVYNTYLSRKLIFGVQAKYTYGKPVIGTVTAKVESQSEQKNIIKIIPINGHATVEFDLKEILADLSLKTDTIAQVELIVLEELTGISVFSKVSIPIYVKDYKISHIENGNFKPGLLYGFFVKVTRPDGKPVIDTVNPISVSYVINQNSTNDLTSNLNEQGMAFIKVTTPRSAKQIDFEITYKDEVDRFTVRCTDFWSSSYIQAHVLTKP